MVVTRTRLGLEWAGASVSWGTLKTEDLIPAFVSVLEEADPEEAARFNREFERWQKRLERAKEGKGKHSVEECVDQLEWILDELYTALGDVAPEGCAFQAHPGDGADFGFWMLDGDEP